MTTIQAKILLVEDDLDVRRLMNRYLKDVGYDVTEADSVGTAFAELKDDSAFDLAIIDFWLGPSSAVDVMDDIKSRFQGVPIIVVSGGNHSMDLETTQAVADVSGAVTFLQKPFTQAAFLAGVAAALQAR